MDHELIIGKYTLESLTNGMYASPLDLYREYIQNAVDSIDAAIMEKLERPEYFEIAININPEKNTLSIFDNGRGLCQNHAISTLIDIGNSNKQRDQNRGFRGIGRLAGLAYAETVQFITSANGELTKSIMTCDCKKMQQLLQKTNTEIVDVMETFKAISSFENLKTKQRRLHVISKLHAPNRYEVVFAHGEAVAFC